VARKGDIPIAAMLSIRHASSVIYKYGCSDESFHRFGGMPFLFWRLIEECKAQGMDEIDFGRSDLDHQGLITFKERFGATRKALTYYRYPSVGKYNMGTGWGVRAIRGAISLLPEKTLPLVGRILYKHVG
jgi:lipid II:glycine glycyltransferase (peptidoglycan interpeptide bridge formation enzyme)